MIVYAGETHLDLRVVREIARQSGVDVSTSLKDERESIVVLSKLKMEQDDQKSLQDCYPILKHLHYAFFLIIDRHDTVDFMTVCNGVEFTNVIVNLDAQLLFATASLQTWVDLIKNHSTRDNDLSIRKMLNSLQGFFEQKGFTFLFKDTIKKPLKDGFYLEQKK